MKREKLRQAVLRLDKSKSDYNQKVLGSKTNATITKKPIVVFDKTIGETAIIEAVFKEPFLCRQWGCTDFTNTVLVIPVSELQKFQEKSHEPLTDDILFYPLCEKHLLEQKASAKVLSNIFAGL